jgi:hypothetical protein
MDLLPSLVKLTCCARRNRVPAPSTARLPVRLGSRRSPGPRSSPRSCLRWPLGLRPPPGPRPCKPPGLWPATPGPTLRRPRAGRRGCARHRHCACAGRRPRSVWIRPASGGACPHRWSSPVPPFDQWDSPAAGGARRRPAEVAHAGGARSHRSSCGGVRSRR